MTSALGFVVFVCLGFFRGGRGCEFQNRRVLSFFVKAAIRLVAKTGSECGKKSRRRK